MPITDKLETRFGLPRWPEGYDGLGNWLGGEKKAKRKNKMAAGK
jgi:hypothetical protein